MPPKHAGKGQVNRKHVLLRIIEARGLLAMDLGGTSDPFCMTHIVNVPGDFCQTSTKMKTLTPVWNEEFEFEVRDELNDKLEFIVLDWDKGTSNDFLGQATFPIAAVTAVGRVDKWLPLLDSGAKVQQQTKKDRGEIHISVTYYDQNGKIPGGGEAPTAPAHPQQHAAAPPNPVMPVQQGAPPPQQHHQQPQYQQPPQQPQYVQQGGPPPQVVYQQQPPPQVVYQQQPQVIYQQPQQPQYFPPPQPQVIYQQQPQYGAPPVQYGGYPAPTSVIPGGQPGYPVFR